MRDHPDGAIVVDTGVGFGNDLIDEDATAGNVDAPHLRAAGIDSIRRIKALRPDVVHVSHCADYRMQPEPPSGS